VDEGTLMIKKTFLLLELLVRSLIPPFYSFSLLEKVFKKKLSKNHKNKEVIWSLGFLYICYRKYEEAKDQFETLLTLGADTRSVRLLLSRAYFNLGEYSKVEEILAGSEILSDRDEEMYYLGESLIELKKYKSGIIYLNRYVSYHHPKNYIVFVKLGYAYYKEGLYNLALESYKKAQRLNPTEKEILESINICVQKLNESAKNN
jgi:tetratricopeptide (TPR) repeat protein